MRRLTTTVATLAALALTSGPAPVTVAAESAPPQERPTTFRLNQLERGPDAAVPYVANKVVVDGDTRTRVPGQLLRLFGVRADGRYLVRVWRDGHSQWRVVTPGGSSRRILREHRGLELTMSDDGTTVVTTRSRGWSAERTRLRVYDALTWEVLHERRARGYVGRVLDADTDTVLYADVDRPAVVWWDLTSGATRRISAAYGVTADLADDRLAVFPEEPGNGGCNVVSTISDPGTTLWRSCDQAVAQFSSHGSHMATVQPDIYYDGYHTFREVRVRSAEGDLVGHYRTGGFHIRDIFFEDAENLLLEVNTDTHAGLVRCSEGTCELAGDLRDSSRWD